MRSPVVCASGVHRAIRAGVTRWLLGGLALVALLPLAGCEQAGAGDVDDSGATLRLAYLPSESDPELRSRASEHLGAYLQERLGMNVEVIRSVQYAPTIEALRANKIDLVRGGSFAYLIAHDKAGAEALVSIGTSQGRGLYRSAIVTRPDSGIDSLEMLLERAAELDFGFVDPASTSGHLVPRAMLESRGVDPDSAFATLVYTMDHTNSAMTIMSGKLDVGAVSRSSLDRLIERGRIQPGELVVLWESEPIPTGPVMVRADLPAHVKKGIVDAFLALNDRQHLLYAELARTYNRDDLVFYEANDAEWDGLRRVAWNLDTMTLLSRHDGGR